MKTPGKERYLLDLRRELKTRRIKISDVADRAGRSSQHVSAALRGRTESQEILDAARALIEESKKA